MTFTLGRFDEAPAPEPPTDTDSGQANEPEPPSVAEQLRAAVADVEKWKQQARKHEERAKANAEKAKRLDAIEEQDRSDLDRVTARAETAELRVTELLARTVAAEVKALAAATWADPDDAPRYLNLTGYVSDTGAIDTETIAKDLAEMLKAKPHLAKTEPGVQLPPPDPSVGPQLQPAADVRSASGEEFAAELARYGLRPRS